MARKSFSVLFFIKKAKLLKNGEAPVCMRITVNGCDNLINQIGNRYANYASRIGIISHE